MRTAKRTPLIHAGRAFVLALAAGLVLVGCMEWSRRNQERDRMGYVASAIGAETYEFMLSEMSKTRVLEAYLIQTSGDYSDFGRVAQSCCGRTMCETSSSRRTGSWTVSFPWRETRMSSG